MTSRRKVLQQSLAVGTSLAATGLFPQFAWAFNKSAFDAKHINEAIAALGGTLPVPSKEVSLTAPDMAENGAVVPLSIATTLVGVKQLVLLVEKNPSALVTVFHLSEAVEPNLSTRVKMAQTSDVYAVAIMNDGKALFARKEVKVTLGGCGQ